MFVSAIIAAAGAGRRLGAAKPKQMLDIGGGSMLHHSLTAFLVHPRVSEVIVVLPKGVSSVVLSGRAMDRAQHLRSVVGGERPHPEHGGFAVEGAAGTGAEHRTGL